MDRRTAVRKNVTHTNAYTSALTVRARSGAHTTFKALPNDSSFSGLTRRALSSHCMIWKTLLKPLKKSKSTSLANTVAPYQGHGVSFLRLLGANNTERTGNSAVNDTSLPIIQETMEGLRTLFTHPDANSYGVKPLAMKAHVPQGTGLKALCCV